MHDNTIKVDTLLLADLVGAATHAIEGFHDVGKTAHAVVTGRAVEKAANELFDGLFSQAFERTISMDLFSTLVQAASEWGDREPDETVRGFFKKAVEDANRLWLRTMTDAFGHCGQ